MTQFSVIAGTHPDGTFAFFDKPVMTDTLEIGDIVQIDNEVYRVYDSGNKGLRYWNVTAKFREQLEKELLENEADYYNTIASFETGTGRL